MGRTEADLKYTPVQDLQNIVELLWKSFDSGITKPIQYRKAQLAQLLKMMKENQSAFEEALFKDLGKCKFDSVIFEVNKAIHEIVHQIEHVDQYAK